MALRVIASARHGTVEEKEKEKEKGRRQSNQSCTRPRTE